MKKLTAKLEAYSAGASRSTQRGPTFDFGDDDTYVSDIEERITRSIQRMEKSAREEPNANKSSHYTYPPDWVVQGPGWRGTPRERGEDSAADELFKGVDKAKHAWQLEMASKVAEATLRTLQAHVSSPEERLAARSTTDPRSASKAPKKVDTSNRPSRPNNEQTGPEVSNPFIKKGDKGKNGDSK
ncbi:hypothetical protein VP1G_10822 [Cytospora mali]|uniref:Uncharacterized protein n=1 Tax=Cytospora mali TaxID=578113 RepID=A0A194UXW7_CYTMA|nr:hypothetical protein VP1G_10822 [Valsa mali var. pyri (nom. inval.)]